MDLLDQADALLTIGRNVTGESGERIEPHRQVMEVLSIAIRFFTDANAARTAEDTVDFRRYPFGLAEVSLLSKLIIQRDEENDAESVRPQIAKPIRPYALFAHPIELVQDIGRFLQHRERYRPKG